MSSQLGSSSTRSTGRTYCGDSEGRSCSGVVSTQRASTGGVARGPSSLVLQPGESALLRFWDGDVSRQRDWQEDAPRAITIQPISRQRGWRPVNGVVVNQPGTSVLRLERAAGPPAGLLQPFARSVVCDVELHDRGTRLTLRSMATVVNQTQRTLAVDLELPHTPMKHLGVLAAGEQLAVAESHLDGGLRITDCGVGASAAQVRWRLTRWMRRSRWGVRGRWSGLDLSYARRRIARRRRRKRRGEVPSRCPDTSSLSARSRALSSRRRSSRASYLLARTHFTSSRA